MQCVEFLKHSERWMEGERNETAATHLKSCANCSALIADLETISGSAAALSEAEPPARVWVSLRNQLEAEGLIHSGAVASSPCADFAVGAERWMEGERDATAVAHLKSCAHCSALIADLESISGSANRLAEAEPPARVWVSLRNQLEAEGLIYEPAEAAVALSPAPRRAFLFGLRPALATALVAVVVIVGGYAAVQRGGVLERSARTSEVSVLDDHGLMAELAALAPVAQAPVPKMHEHNPVVTAAYKQNMEIVDNAIAICEKTIKEQPRNEAALEYLRAAYQQRAELLASIGQRGIMGD